MSNMILLQQMYFLCLAVKCNVHEIRVPVSYADRVSSSVLLLCIR